MSRLAQGSEPKCRVGANGRALLDEKTRGQKQPKHLQETDKLGQMETQVNRNLTLHKQHKGTKKRRVSWSRIVSCVPIPILPYYLVCQKKRFSMSQYIVCQMQIPGCPSTSGHILQYASQHAFLAILTILSVVVSLVVVCPNSMHTVCNSTYFVRAAAVRTKSKRKSRRFGKQPRREFTNTSLIDCLLRKALGVWTCGSWWRRYFHCVNSDTGHYQGRGGSGISLKDANR